MRNAPSDRRPRPDAPGRAGFDSRDDVVVVLTPKGKQLTYSESQFRSYWERGFLEPGVRCWREGMAGFVSVDDYFAHAEPATSGGPAAPSTANVNDRPAPPPAAPPGPPGAPTLRGVHVTLRPLAGLGTAVVVLLWLNVVAEALTIHSNFSLHAFLGSPTSAAEAERLDAHAMLVDAVAFWLLVATAVVFLVWLHRATSNARRLAGDSFAFSPGWAVGYWFIPIINLYRPYQVVRDVYRTSRNHANPRPATALRSSAGGGACGSRAVSSSHGR